jgi:hypothetical protein
MAQFDELLAADSNLQSSPYLASHASASACSASAAVTRTAVPSTISLPVFQPLAPVVPVVTRHVLVAVEVALLLLLWAGTERERAVVPDAQKWYGVRAAVRADSDDPVELRVSEEALDVIPRWWRTGRRTLGQSFRLSCSDRLGVGRRPSARSTEPICLARARTDWVGWATSQMLADRSDRKIR